MRQSDVYGDPSYGPLFERSLFADSKFEPTHEERKVGELIARHHGSVHPISIAEIQRATGLTERAIKGAVEKLIVDHKIRIGARRMAPVGYFMIETATDQEAALRPYRNQMIAMARRLRVLDSPANLRKLFGQIEMEFKENS